MLKIVILLALSCIVIIGIYYKYFKSLPAYWKSCKHTSKEKQAKNDHAIVIGAGIGGLFTAKALSKYFKKVTLIDRDEEIPSPFIDKIRRCTPQAKQVHGMLMRGQLLMEKLFPGITREMEHAGAIRVDWGSEMKWYNQGKWKKSLKPGASKLSTLSATRPFFEWHIVQRIKQVPNIEVIHNCPVTSLISTEDGAKIIGVNVNRKSKVLQQESTKSKTTTTSEQILADFIADCSGERASTHKWIEQITGNKVEIETLNANMCYSSGVYKPTKEQLAKKKWKAFFTYPEPPATSRGAVLLPIENGYYFILLAGYHANPPHTQEDVVSYVTNGVPQPEEILQALAEWEPVYSHSTYSDRPNQWRRFDRVSNWPNNFVALGDNIARFNPSYGQGMTHAALHVIVLEKAIRLHLQNRADCDFCGLAQYFQKRAAKITRVFWLGSTTSDLIQPTTLGERTLWKSMLALLFKSLVNVCMDTAFGANLFMEINHCVTMPYEFLRPTIIFPALWHMKAKALSMVFNHLQGKPVTV